MGGTIDVDSRARPGQHVLRSSCRSAPAHGVLDVRAPQAELRGLKVLVVDDNATNRRVLEAYLAAWGMRSELAEDGPTALECLQAAAEAGEPFDARAARLPHAGHGRRRAGSADHGAARAALDAPGHADVVRTPARAARARSASPSS